MTLLIPSLRTTLLVFNPARNSNEHLPCALNTCWFSQQGAAVADEQHSNIPQPPAAQTAAQATR